MLDRVYLGSAPCDEACAQVGSDGYGVIARAECRAYIAQLRRLAAAEGRAIPEGCRLRVKSEAHDFGEYLEVVAQFDDADEVAAECAYWLEEHMPTKWDDEARVELFAAMVA